VIPHRSIALAFFCWLIAYEVHSQTAVPSHETGCYEAPFNLTFELPEGTQLYYTTDGSDPYPKGKTYSKKDIEIGDRATLPPRIDSIPTTPLTGPWQLAYFIWKPPAPRVDSLWILRYSLIKDQQIVETNAISYFIGKEWKTKHHFPIVSIITDPKSLFSADSGLFVPGNAYDESAWEDHFFGTGNYTLRGKSWQRDGWFTLYDSLLQPHYNVPIDYRIHGAVVGVFPQKSMRIYTDKSPGSRPLPFQTLVAGDSTELHRFILRNSGSDFVSTHFRDAFLGEVAAELGLEHQKGAPIVLYINGIYWGTLNLRERIDRYYIAEHFGIAEDSYDMIEGSGGDVLNGSNEDFIALLQTVYESDLAVDSVYEKVISQIDLANYIDYNLFQTFFCNMDWPGNNVKFWRPKEGKWRWIFFDGDLTISPYEYNKDGGFEHNALAHAIADTNNQWYNQPGSTFLLRNLMKNEQFKTALLDRYEELAQDLFNPDRLIALLERYEADYSSEMKQHIERWNYPSSLAAWQHEVDALKSFVSKRPLEYKKHLSSLSEQETK